MGVIDQIRERQRERKRELSSNLTSDLILGMKLSEFARHDISLRIHSEVLSCDVWLCSNEKTALQVKEDKPGAITYTINELRKLYKLQPSPEDLRTIHDTKSIFPRSKIIDSSLKETSDKSDRT